MIVQRSLFLLSFLLLNTFQAQESKDTLVKSYELPSAQYKAWKIIEQQWMSKEYGKILKENKLKMSCNGCEAIFMDVVLKIDSVGKLKEYKTVKTRKCAGEFSKKLEELFLKWFLNLSFPSELYDLKFEVRLGTGLKC